MFTTEYESAIFAKCQEFEMKDGKEVIVRIELYVVFKADFDLFQPIRTSVTIPTLEYVASLSRFKQASFPIVDSTVGVEGSQQSPTV